MVPWFGVTHYVPVWLLWLWRLLLCRVGWHLLDEVLSAGDEGPEHYLFCDACELTIHVTEKGM